MTIDAMERTIPLPGMTEVTVDDNIVLQNSNAVAGVNIRGLGEPIDCEIFGGIGDTLVEIYPLDGNDQPFLAEVGPNFGFDDASIIRAVQCGMHDRAVGRSLEEL